MRKKSPSYLIPLLLFMGIFASAQKTSEREHRIRKVQFPEKALTYIEQSLDNVKRIKFYKEIDSSTVSYKAKFKKDRLWYGIEFDKTGDIGTIEIAIKSIDIPDDALRAMLSYLEGNFKKYKIRKIFQQYPVTEMNSLEETTKNAFQNLMLPTNYYELIVSGKRERKSEQHEVLFDSGGNFNAIRKSLPPNYDHVLY